MYYSQAYQTLGWFLLIVILGVCYFVFNQKMSFVDSLYLTVISSSTVGFGDLHIRHTNNAELFTSIWLIFSTVGVAKVPSTFLFLPVPSTNFSRSLSLFLSHSDGYFVVCKLLRPPPPPTHTHAISLLSCRS